jgi:hypothetical protein
MANSLYGMMPASADIFPGLRQGAHTCGFSAVQEITMFCAIAFSQKRPATSESFSAEKNDFLQASSTMKHSKN